MKKRDSIHIGCSGWNYDHWKGLFYPEDSHPEGWFGEYSSVFSTVEINNTFYRLPEKSVFRKWQKQAPEGFIFAVKANRFITHMKKLKEAKEPLELFLERVKLLRPHLGPVLFQLPPRWNVNPERFDAFTKLLPASVRSVFEFRDKSWYCDKIFDIMRRRKISLCLHDMPGSESPEVSLGPICYLRLHGASGVYNGGYPLKVLNRRARYINEQSRSGKDVYVYFNNDAEAHAPRDAEKLISEVDKLEKDG